MQSMATEFHKGIADGALIEMKGHFVVLFRIN